MADMNLPAEGQLGVCARCGTEIMWEFDDPDPQSDNPYGLWLDQEGRDICIATSVDSDDFFHVPEED